MESRKAVAQAAWMGRKKAATDVGTKKYGCERYVDHVDDRMLYADGFKQDHTFFWKKLDISIIILDKQKIFFSGGEKENY